jgi:hypothetical protein
VSKELTTQGQWYEDNEKVELVKRMICKGSTDDEFALFMTQCQRIQLDPMARQVFAVKRWDKAEGRMSMAIQVSIDGFRLIADRHRRLPRPDAAGVVRTRWGMARSVARQGPACGCPLRRLPQELPRPRVRRGALCGLRADHKRGCG